MRGCGASAAVSTAGAGGAFEEASSIFFFLSSVSVCVVWYCGKVLYRARVWLLGVVSKAGFGWPRSGMIKPEVE